MRTQIKSILLKILFPALLSLIVGYLLGVSEHKRSTDWEKRKLMHEQQVKAWQSMASDFPRYIVTRSRLRDISDFQRANESNLSNELKLKIASRKDQYIIERDASRLDLMADLEQAKFLFPKSTLIIDSFQEFDSKARTLTLSELPPESKWQSHMNSILSTTFEEIKPL